MPVSVAAYVPRFGIALATFALLAGAAFAGETGDKIPVRAADHGDYGRIVFDWNGPVGHSVTVVGRELTVAFDKPMDGSFESVLRWLKDYVSAARLEDGGHKAVFTLNGDFTASDFESGNSLAVDLRRAPASAKADGERRVAVRAGQHGDFSRVVIDWPGLIDYKATPSERGLTLIFPQSAAFDLDAVKRDLPPFVTGIGAKPQGSGVAVTITGVDAARFRHFRSETKVVVDVLPPASAAEHALLPAEGPSSDGAPVPKPPAEPAASGSTPSGASPGGSTNAPQPAPTDAKPPVVVPQHHRAMVADLADEAIKAGDKTPVSLLPEKEIAGASPLPATNQLLTGALKPAAAMSAAAAAPLPPPTVQAALAQPAPAQPPVQQVPASPAKAAAPIAPKTSSTPPAVQPPANLAPMSQAATQTKASPAPPAQPPAASPASQAAAQALAQPAPLAPAVESKPVVVTAKAEKAALSVTFAWKDPVGAAVFRRDGVFWVVFDRKAQFDLSGLESWHKEVALTEIDVAGASALRLSGGPAMSASVRREATSVSIVLSRNPARVANAVAPARSGESGEHMLLPLADARNPVVVPDAEVGDKLIVVPVMAAGEGVTSERSYALFRLLATVSGIVIEPRADGVAVKSLPEGVEISSPDGLFLSSKNGALPAANAAAGAAPPSELPPAQTAAAPGESPAPQPPSDTAAANRSGAAAPASGDTPAASGEAVSASANKLFNFAAWIHGDARFEEVRTSLLKAVLASPAQRRNEARLELARFYFARGLYADAVGVLGMIAANDPQAAQSPAFLSLRGAASYLMDNYDQATADLGNPALSTYPDAELWRGAVAAAQAHWADAVPSFAQVGDRIQEYPIALKVKFGLLAAETAINSHEFPAAQTYLDFVAGAGPDKLGEAHVKYLLGLLATTRRETDKAAGLYDEAIANGDPAVKAKAKFAKVTMLLEAKKIPAKEAIDSLEDLRFAWRGDSMEFDVLRRLGDLYLASGEYEKGLTTLKRAVTFFPDDPRAKDAADAMNVAFAKLYVDGAADNLPPLKALGIYRDFRELTPPGAPGDAVIRNLAERMVAVDLLTDAGDLLEPLVASRLQGADKLAAGTRLAVIRLLDKKPDKALDALKASATDKIPADVAAERRRIEARAYADQDKGKEAMAALEGDSSRDADLLRSDVLWHERNWAEAAKVLGRLTETPDGKTDGEGAAPDNQTAQLIVRRAAALWLAGDEDALANLRDRFAEKLAKTPYNNDFRVIAAAQAGEVDSVEAVTARLADVDAYAAFAADLKAAPKAVNKDDAPKAAADAKEVAAKVP